VEGEAVGSIQQQGARRKLGCEDEQQGRKDSWDCYADLDGKQGAWQVEGDVVGSSQQQGLRGWEDEQQRGIEPWDCDTDLGGKVRRSISGDGTAGRGRSGSAEQGGGAVERDVVEWYLQRLPNQQRVHEQRDVLQSKALGMVEDVLNRCEQNLLQLGDELDRQATTSMRIFENGLDAYGDSFDCFHLKFPAKVSLQKGLQGRNNTLSRHLGVLTMLVDALHKRGPALEGDLQKLRDSRPKGATPETLSELLPGKEKEEKVRRPGSRL